MDLYTSASIVITIAILIAYVNHRFIRMQTTIAIMTASMLISLVIILLQHFGVTDITTQTANLVQKADFQHLLLKSILSFLLFAGTLSIDITELKNQKWEIGILASISTIASTVIIGICFYYLLPLFNVTVPFVYCLLFGALISPTDPIAVLATFKKLGVSKRIQTCVAGESLFNDGVGIVIFTAIYQLTFHHEPITFSNVSLLFLKEAVGGLGYGLILGVITFWLVKPVKDSKIVTLLTLAMVTGGYTFALWLDISGPLAMVVFGIYLGNKIRQHAPQEVKHTLEIFWELTDEILNAVLFFLIGLEIITIHLDGARIAATFIAIPVVLLIRLVTVAIPMKLLQIRRSHASHTIAILTWGGLRGGLALALVLSLPLAGDLDIITSITYGIVAFSVIIQGLTIKPLALLSK